MKKQEVAENVLNYVITEFRNRQLLELLIFDEEFGARSWDEVVEGIKQRLSLIDKD